MSFVPGRPFVSVTAALALLSAVVLVIGRSASPAAPTEARPAGGPAGRAATLELAPGQLDALRIERAAPHSFPVVKHAVGSISFEEDPAIVQSESTLLAAAANLELNSKELRRVSSLGENNGIAQKEIEQARASEQSARAALKAARDALRALGKSDAELDRLITRGAIPTDSRSHRKWGLANVAESDSVQVRPGQPVALTVIAYPGRTFSGTVSHVYAAVDPGTHRVAVRAQVADPRGELRAGMLAEFAIGVAAAVPATAIPANGAVREADGTTTVWVTTDRHRFTQRTVRTGERDAGWVQILEGVQPGELVVTDGAVFLSNLLQAPPSD